MVVSLSILVKYRYGMCYRLNLQLMTIVLFKETCSYYWNTAQSRLLSCT